MSVTVRLQPFRVPLKVAYDALAWGAATAAAMMLRYQLPGDVSWHAAAGLALALGTVYFLVGLLVQLHQGRAATGSLEEMLLVGCVATTAGITVFAVNLAVLVVPRSVPVGATICFIVAAALGRATWRTATERPLAACEASTSTRVLVVGAGEPARALIGSMLRDPERKWHPVGLVEDDRARRHLRIRGVPVLGTTAVIDRLVEQTEAEALVVAIPDASPEMLGRIAEAGGAAGVDVKVLPSTSEMLSANVGISSLRDIDIHDVLGRKQIDTDVASIAGYLTGRRVLVTGAGGSIGSELCRQISMYGLAELIMLDRDESALHAVQLSLTGRALLDGRDVVLCDIRDAEALNQVFLSRRPDVVFHAAALKHLPMLEQYPAEAVKTNVIGTLNVLTAAARADVELLVNISTDKAANPTCVLGYSKRVAERITAAFARSASGNYLSVRFGNVLGSRGSVLTTFAQQIADGGPITVTDPDITRYFMTVEEACQLVVQAGAIGRPGEALVLEMGEPVKILDVAHHLIRLAHRPVKVEFTGLRAGEKLHEELFSDSEPRDVRPWHPQVSHVPVAALDPHLAAEMPTSGRRADVITALAHGCCESWNNGNHDHEARPMGETVSRSRE